MTVEDGSRCARRTARTVSCHPRADEASSFNAGGLGRWARSLGQASQPAEGAVLVTAVDGDIRAPIMSVLSGLYERSRSTSALTGIWHMRFGEKSLSVLLRGVRWPLRTASRIGNFADSPTFSLKLHTPERLRST